MEQTTDGGGHWVADTDGVTGLGLNAISCADPEDCVAVGGVSLGGIIGVSNAVLVTSNGGLTWHASTDPSVDGYLTSVSCPDAGHCWATASVGIVGRSTVIATTDGGSSWTNLSWNAPLLPANQSAPMSSQLDAMTCPTTSDCVAVGQATYETTLPPSILNEGVISTTNDGGHTWQSQLIAANDITGISCPDAHECVAVGQDSVVAGQTSDYSAYQVVTTDGAATWNVSPLGDGAPLAGGNAPAIDAISCPDTLHCVAVGAVFNDNKYMTAVITTSDGGDSWSNQATAVPTGAPLEGIACVTSSTCWAVGFTSGGSVIVHTIDSGVAWPSVTGISPGQGPVGGGVPVSITGAGFQFGTPTVQFGSMSATDVSVTSDSEITAIVPPSASPGESSTVDVTVNTPFGTSPLNTDDQYTYQSSGSQSTAEETALPLGNLILDWLRSTTPS